MPSRAFNPQIFLEFLCYCVFGGLIFYLVSSGKYLSYVTPRMEPYLYFTVIIMGVWALAGLRRLFRPQHKIRSVHCFVLVIPILLLLLPHSLLSASDLSGNYAAGITLSNQSGQNTDSGSQQQKSSDSSGPSTSSGTASAKDASAAAGNDPSSTGTAPADSADSVVSDTQSDIPEDPSSPNLPGLDEPNKKITVSNEDFSMWLSVLNEDMERYVGYTVTITGCVYNDPQVMQSDEFIPGRMMMSCCVADLTLAGLVCKYDKASELEKDSWVTVEGTLFIGQYEYNGEKYDEPKLTVTKITPAEEVEGYVYPYF